MDVGDAVHLVFWRPWAMLGNPGNGSWDTVAARVVSLRVNGAVLCVALDNPNLPAYFGGDVVGDALRFVASADAFLTQELAQENLKSRLPKT